MDFNRTGHLKILGASVSSHFGNRLCVCGLCSASNGQQSPPFEGSDDVPQPVGSVIHVNHCSRFQSVSLNLVMIYDQAGA